MVGITILSPVWSKWKEIFKLTCLLKLGGTRTTCMVLVSKLSKKWRSRSAGLPAYLISFNIELGLMCLTSSCIHACRVSTAFLE